MKLKLKRKVSVNKNLMYGLGFIALVCLLMLYKLGSLTHGVSPLEAQSASQPVGLRGIYHSPFYVPIKLVRSIDFYLFKAHGKFLTRLPNAFFGGLSILSFALIAYLWHGKRTSILATLLFGCSAWLLHVSRVASFDVMYLWAIISLILGYVLLSKFEDNIWAWLYNCLIWGVLLTMPGMIWLVIIDIFMRRDLIVDSLTKFNKLWQRLLSLILIVLWLPLVIRHMILAHQIRVWLGLPQHFAKPLHLLKDYLAVYVHLFIRGPETPILWLGKAPLLDLFTLACSIIGIYFYAKNFRHRRSQLLLVTFLVSSVLVALGGSVPFSLVVPFMYLLAAMGLTYLIHNWLKVFPKNPMARFLGISLISLAVMVSCIYNLRAYFIAWPNNPTTKSIFSRHI